MKSHFVLVFIVLAIASAALAITNEFVYNSVSSYSGTKGQITVPVTYTAPIAYQTAGTCKVFINGTSARTGFPVTANTLYKAQTTSDTSRLIFLCNSSAAATNTIYVMK